MKNFRWFSLGIWILTAALPIVSCSSMAPKPVDAKSVSIDLQRYFAPTPEIKIAIVGNLIIVEGQVSSIEQLERVNLTVRDLDKALGVQHNIRVSSHVDLSDNTKNNIAEKIERLIGAPEITARYQGSTVIIEGTAENDFEADRAIELTRSVFYSLGDMASRKAASQTSEPTRATPLMIIDMLRVKIKK